MCLGREIRKLVAVFQKRHEQENHMQTRRAVIPKDACSELKVLCREPRLVQHFRLLSLTAEWCRLTSNSNPVHTCADTT